MLLQLDTEKRIPMQAHVHSCCAVFHQYGFVQKCLQLLASVDVPSLLH